MVPQTFLSIRPKVICFDADDTLWKNDEYYQSAEYAFSNLLLDYCAQEKSLNTLYDWEMRNLDLLGYGAKSFTISMIEAALEITQSQLPASILTHLITIGKENSAPPMELYPMIAETLSKLTPHYRLALATKGDLLDQERKLERSGLAPFFEYVSISSKKNKDVYAKIMKNLSLMPMEFMMVGNSFKSDILPVLQLGAQAVYIPSSVLWVHEQAEPIEHPLLKTVEHIEQLLSLLL